jgi:hypothetical protein
LKNTFSAINDATLGLLNVIQNKNISNCNFMNKCKPMAHSLTPTKKDGIEVPYVNKINSK